MHVICLDFDGVICDSLEELAQSGYRTAQLIWPESVSRPPPADFINRFARVRSVLNCGYESVLLIKLLESGLHPDAIIADFPGLFRKLILDSGLTVDQLVRIFGDTRDRSMKSDYSGWLKCHRFYPQTTATINRITRTPACRLFVITTKEKRFAMSLIEAYRLAIPENRVFGFRDGKKVEILRDLQTRPELAMFQFHFIDDRVDTLIEIADAKELETIHLYLATWGYNTANQRQRIENQARIRAINEAEFAAMFATLTATNSLDNR